jgi:hypothetical protein
MGDNPVESVSKAQQGMSLMNDDQCHTATGKERKRILPRNGVTKVGSHHPVTISDLLFTEELFLLVCLSTRLAFTHD